MTNEEARIGVYICECGANIAATVNVPEVVEFARTLPHVAVARMHKYTCSEPGQNMIKEDIKNLGINRVVVASCSPRMHEPTFQTAVASAGLNPYYFAMANIREHVSWVIRDQAQATQKARRLVAAAVARVALQQELFARTQKVTPAALVVGGGIAGIQAALTIADAGYKVYLVERLPSIGGHMAQLDKTFPTLDCSICILGPKMVDASRHPNIQLLSYSEVESVSGYVGNFDVRIRKKARYVDEEKCTGCGTCETKCPSKALDTVFEVGLKQRKAIYRLYGQAIPNVPVIDREACIYFLKGKCRACEKFCGPGAIDFEQQDQVLDLKVGTIVVATGFAMWDPTRLSQYSYGKSPNIITGLQFERMSNASGPTAGQILTSEGKTPERVAIIHCVGSRDHHAHEYCSRICCMYALKHAHMVHDKTGAEVYEFYMDMRAFGKGYEEFYERVQGEGVYMVRGKGAEVTVLPDGRLRVTGENTNLGLLVSVDVDMVVLASAIEAQPDAARIGALFGLGRSADGFFAEAHPKLRPVETNTDGVFLAGCAQGPKDVPDTVAQAGAAASMALALLNKGEVTISPTVAEVVRERCVGCGDCLPVCPYTAITRVEGKAQVNQALCKGCGTCVATCPSGAIEALHFTDEQLVAQIEGVLAWM